MAAGLTAIAAGAAARGAVVARGAAVAAVPAIPIAVVTTAKPTSHRRFVPPCLRSMDMRSP